MTRRFRFACLAHHGTFISPVFFVQLPVAPPYAHTATCTDLRQPAASCTHRRTPAPRRQTFHVQQRPAKKDINKPPPAPLPAVPSSAAVRSCPRSVHFRLHSLRIFILFASLLCMLQFPPVLQLRFSFCNAPQPLSHHAFSHV